MGVASRMRQPPTTNHQPPGHHLRESSDNHTVPRCHFAALQTVDCCVAARNRCDSCIIVSPFLPVPYGFAGSFRSAGEKHHCALDALITVRQRRLTTFVLTRGRKRSRTRPGGADQTMVPLGATRCDTRRSACGLLARQTGQKPNFMGGRSHVAAGLQGQIASDHKAGTGDKCWIARRPTSSSPWPAPPS